MLELKGKEWNHLLKNFAGLIDTNSKDDKLKIPTIRSIRSVCEILNRKEIVLPDEELEGIFVGIMLCIKPEEKNKEIKLIALQSLIDSSSYYHKYLDEQE